MGRVQISNVEIATHLDAASGPFAMGSNSELLLTLYRGARTLPVEEFQSFAIRLIRPVLRFESPSGAKGIFRSGVISSCATTRDGSVDGVTWSRPWRVLRSRCLNGFPIHRPDPNDQFSDQNERIAKCS